MQCLNLKCSRVGLAPGSPCGPLDVCDTTSGGICGSAGKCVATSVPLGSKCDDFRQCQTGSVCRTFLSYDNSAKFCLLPSAPNAVHIISLLMFVIDSGVYST